MDRKMGDTQRSQTISTKLCQIAEQARNHPDRIFTSLAHLMDTELLHVAFDKTRKDAAPGVDGVTGTKYAENLQENLTALHKRLRQKQYKAPPIKRAWIDKDDGSKRPLGMPIFEDKVVQRAATMIMSAIYEQDFYDFSYGFREAKSPLGAIKALRELCYRLNIRWIVDADIRKFFDSIDHTILMDIIKRRINDGGLLRLIGKWLNAGVLEDGNLSYPEDGTPQGGVISPLLANIFLHHVLDEWFVKEIKPRLKGRCFLIRFADDFVIGCEFESDARRLMAVLPKRFNRFQLTIHPEKTVLVDFRPPNQREGSSNPTTFDFLAFTHYWAKSRNGNWVIKRKTARKRLKRAMKAVWQWCRENQHDKLSEQYATLRSKLLGHYHYYGIRGNYQTMEVYFRHVIKSWRRWLGRRSRNGYITCKNFSERYLKAFPLPPPRIVHCF
jgi:group II intron reverse transcriptase/maturase